MTYPRKFEAIQRHAERVQLDSGRYKTLIRCQRCNQLHDRRDVQANHIHPVGRLESTSEQDIQAYRDRLFCHPKLIEPLCLKCHQALSREQRTLQTTH